MKAKDMTFELINNDNESITEEKRMTEFEANNKNYTLRSRRVNSKWVVKQ